MKPTIPLLALVILITSCTEIDKVFDNCKFAFAGETIKISGNTETFYINYPLQDEYAQANFNLWDNLVNNKVIALSKDGESYKITNLLNENIDICTKSKDSTLEYYYEQQQDIAENSNDNSATLIENNLI